MIVARLSYEADERDLEREFSRFGPIERVGVFLLGACSNACAHILTSFQIRIVKENPAYAKPNKKTKPHRGYAFVVFERERDMRGNLSPSPFLFYCPPWEHCLSE